MIREPNNDVPVRRRGSRLGAPVDKATDRNPAQTEKKRSKPLQAYAEPRRWCIPSVALLDLADPLEASGLLHEYDGPLGLLLWQSARDVGLWASTPPAVRNALFAQDRSGLLQAAQDAQVPERISGPIRTLAQLLANPETADPLLLSVGCMEVSTWARETGATRTALAFAQAAAMASPGFAQSAMLAGICAMDAGQWSRADAWLRRAGAVARRKRDGISIASSYVLLGKIYERQGDAPRAEQYYRRGYREGRRRSLPVVRRDAAFGLFQLLRDRGEMAGAAQFALAAGRAQRPGQPDGPAILMVLSRFWADLGDDRRAALMLRMLMGTRQLTPSTALVVMGLMARVLARKRPRKAKKAAIATLRLLATEAPSDALVARTALDVAQSAAARHDRAMFDRAVRLVYRHSGTDDYPQMRAAIAGLIEQAFSDP